jgi:hypothetical protein
MKFSVKTEEKDQLMNELKSANVEFQKKYPGDKPDRQAVHTVYGGANLFKNDTTVKMGEVALRNLKTYAPDFVTLANVLKLEGFEHLPHRGKDIIALKEKLDHQTEVERKKDLITKAHDNVLYLLFEK